MINKFKNFISIFYEKLKQIDKEILFIIIIIVIAFIYFGISQLNKNKFSDENIENTVFNENKDKNIKMNKKEKSKLKNDDFFNDENINLENDDVSESLKLSKEKPEIYVHIDGQVNSPGVLKLKDGDRLITAVKKAKGLTKLADTKVVNLAMKLEDGSKIYIPSKKEVEKLNTDSLDDNTILNSENFINFNDSNNLNNKTSDDKNKKININLATIQDLIKIKGVGNSTAENIIKYRKDNGKFKNIEQLLEVPGIGTSKLEIIKDSIQIK